MNELILFLIESSLILGILYLIYYLLLRRETSFHFNRFYLLGILVFAFVLPLLSIDFTSEERGMIDQPIHQLSDARLSYQEAVKEWSYAIYDQDFNVSSMATSYKGERINWTIKILLVVYCVGFIAVISRLIWTLSWIIKLKSGNQKEVMRGITVVKVPYQIAPFSFLNSVFVSKETMEEDSFLDILEHEKTHIRQRHSFDLLIVQLLTTIFWFNPVVWWLSKSLKTTHEYIADRNMIKQGYSLVEYQTLLLRQLISNNSFGLVHNFNLSFIKKRITMMNIQKMGGLGKFKVASVIAFTIAFSLIIVQCNSVAQVSDLTIAEEFSVDLPVLKNTNVTIDIHNKAKLDIIIKNDRIYVNKEHLSLDDLKQLEGDFHPKTYVVLGVDKNQKMKLVYNVQEILREKDLRTLVYKGVNEARQTVNVTLMLPPHPNSKYGIKIPELTDEFILENGIYMIEMNMSDSGVDYESFVYNGLKNPMVNKNSFVFRGRYSDDTSYEDYLIGLAQIKQGFYKLYDERALEMFGKSFSQINSQRETSEEAHTQYQEVKKGIPMAISIEKM